MATHSSVMSMLLTPAVAVVLCADAVSQRTGPLNWHVRVDGATTMNEARSYRLYEEPEELVIDIGLTNAQGPAITVTPLIIRQAVSFQTVAPAIGIIVDWDASVAAEGIPAGRPVAESTPFRIHSSRGPVFRAKLRRADRGRFVSGKYVIGIRINLSEALGDDGTAWKGRLVFPETDVSVVVGPPSVMERGAASRQAGRRAASLGRVAEAIASFEAAIAINQTDIDAHVGLGRVLVNASRYKEAMERLLALPSRFQAHPTIAMVLAEAMVGVGNESAALQVLQTGGHSAENAGELVLRMRGAVSRRRQ